MTGLLLHSMSEFEELILKSLRHSNINVILEIGSGNGDLTESLIDFVVERNGSLTIIDTYPASWIIETQLKFVQNVSLFQEKSIVAIPKLERLGCVVIDGDHNYYTVLKELELIASFLPCGDFPLILIHDVYGPCARRDFYADVRSIPRNWLNSPCGIASALPVIELAFGKKGTFFSDGSALSSDSGGTQNGILTAIETFIERERVWDFYCVPCCFGLGVLCHHKAPYRDEIKTIFSPFHDNKMLKRLEYQRYTLFGALMSEMGIVDDIFCSANNAVWVELQNSFDGGHGHDADGVFSQGS